MPISKPAFYDATDADRMKVLTGVRLASFGRRGAAFVVDFVLAGALFLALVMLAIEIVKHVPALKAWDANRNVKIELNFYHNWYSVVYLVVFFGLSLYWGRGRTPGKRFMGIRVVSLRHDRLSLWTCVERALGYGASALELGFGFIQYFIHPNHQTVHDRIAETIVIDERGIGSRAHSEADPA
jgi:uncharacterized RDD family membrane protein YckC